MPTYEFFIQKFLMSKHNLVHDDQWLGDDKNFRPDIEFFERIYFCRSGRDESNDEILGFFILEKT